MEIGNLFIISAPSGTGKTTVLKRIISEMENIMFSVSHTTRPPRPSEKEGVDYYFVEKDAFQKMQEQDLFHEWAEVHGNLYGTSRNAVQEIIDQGQDIILDIDVQGGLQAMDKVGDKGIFIFILPPSLQ
jgi:guanylate kinase